MAEKELKDEKAAAPLSRQGGCPSHRLERESCPRPRKRLRAKKAKKAKGRPALGNLSAFGGNTETGSRGATDQYPGWTRVDFVVDSGASATTLLRKLLGESSKLKEPVGYRSFRLADGSMVANEGTLEAKAPAAILGGQTARLSLPSWCCVWL